MSDWSKFFNDIGQIAKEFSAVQKAKSHPNEKVESGESGESFAPLRDSVIGEDSNSNESAAVALVATSEQSARESHESKQQRADDEEEQGNRPEATQEAKSNENNAAAAAFAALGVAALGLGAYAAYKSYFNFNKDDEPLGFVNSKSDCIKLLEKFNEDIVEFPVIGLDCQWVINKSPYEPRNPIALLQLATHKGKIMLVPMKKFTYPDELRNILNNSEIIKTGIEVIKDARFLREDHGLEVQSTFDIRFLAEDTGHRPVGLEGLSKDVLNLDLSLEKENENSDWNKLPLKKQQITYAEAVVKASIDIFTTLYPSTNSGESSKDVLAYCSTNKDKPFIWNAQKWD